jgi:ribosome-binding factor A
VAYLGMPVKDNVMDYKRSDRIADLLQQEIAELLLRRVKDPRVAGITITGVDVTSDLQNAKIFYCLMGTHGEQERAHASEGLKKAAGFIRQELGRRLYMKHVPRLDFRYDTSFEYGDKIERLLKKLHEDE